MAKNLKLSPSIWFATISLTLLNLAVFVFFGIMQKHMLVAGAACFLFQVFVVTLIAFPNFYYLKIKDHLIADIAQTHALGVKQEHTKKQFLDATRTSFSQLSTETESRLSEIENLRSELASDSNRKLISEIRNTEKRTLSQTSEIARKIETDLQRLAKDLPARIENAYERIDALLSLHQVIEIAKPLPIMHDWRISSDYAAALVKTILDSNGGTVIDVGSGVSTIVMGYAAKRKGNIKIVSLEHSEEYFEKTKKLIEEHDLKNYCEVLLCPLKETTINGEKWLWYDIDKLELDSVMMVSVDGPPGVTQKLARYPAVPLLKRFIDRNTVVLLDDANRADEAEIASRWQEEYELEGEKVDSHKGYFRFF